MFITTFKKNHLPIQSSLKRNVCMTYDKIPRDTSYIGVANTLLVYGSHYEHYYY